MTELYSVPVGGGRVSLVLTTPALDATVSSKGDKIIFHDYKGYESDWRKHHTSAVTRDIWVYDTNVRKYTQVSEEEAVDYARTLWRTINKPNLVENIAPTRGRATLVIRKGQDHKVRKLSLRKL
jgi:hypothetical protein